MNNNIFVSELPEKPKIFDESDKEVVGVAGPYIEDTSIKLTCVVSGGKTSGNIYLWQHVDTHLLTNVA